MRARLRRKLVRQKMRRLLALVSYVRKRLQGLPDGESEAKVLCVAFRADCAAYRALGRSISGALWLKGSDYPLPYVEVDRRRYVLRLKS